MCIHYKEKNLFALFPDKFASQFCKRCHKHIKTGNLSSHHICICKSCYCNTCYIYDKCGSDHESYCQNERESLNKEYIDKFRGIPQDVSTSWLAYQYLDTVLVPPVLRSTISNKQNETPFKAVCLAAAIARNVTGELNTSKYLSGGGYAKCCQLEDNSSPVLDTKSDTAILNDSDIVLSPERPQDNSKMINKRFDRNKCKVVYFMSQESSKSCCIHVGINNNQMFFSLNDIYGLLKEACEWSRQLKSKKLRSMLGKLNSVAGFVASFYETCQDKTSPYISERGLFYILVDSQLEEPYKFSASKLCQFLLALSSRSNLGIVVYQMLLSKLIKHDQSEDMTDVSSNNCSLTHGKTDNQLMKFVQRLKQPKSSKVLPPLSDIIASYSQDDGKKNENIKEFLHECTKYELSTSEEQEWFADLINKMTDLGEDISRLFDLEIKYHKKRVETGEIDYKLFSVVDEYRAHVSWPLRLLMETALKNKSLYSNPNLKRDHTIKKLTKSYFGLHTLLNIKNATHTGPLQKQLGDIMYTKHMDIKYCYNLMSHLSVMDSLKTVTDRQKSMAAQHNIKEIIDNTKDLSFVLLWDNFVKTHITHDTTFGQQHSSTNEILNKTLLGLPSVRSCKFCKELCHCEWSKDKTPKEIQFDEIFPSEQESKALSKFRRNNMIIAIKEVFDISEEIEAAINDEDIKTVVTESTEVICAARDLEQEDRNKSDNTEHNSKFKLFVDNDSIQEKDKDSLAEGLKTRHGSRTDYVHDAKVAVEDEGIRITLKAACGKDTDWNVAKEIIREATELCNREKDPNFRLFVGGDQKTMGLVLKMKMQWPEEFRHVYVGIPDLHLRKSMTRATFKRYGPLGLRHLAFLAGYKTVEQWKFLEDVYSIPKSFAFVERVYYVLRMALAYEYLKSLDEEEQKLTQELIEKRELDHVLVKFAEFVEQGKQKDLTWKKNFEMLEALENIVGHYIAERSRNFPLRIACIKEFTPFALTANCTLYGPLLIELLYHQSSFQPRYRELLSTFFAYPINVKSTEEGCDRIYVGWDAIAEDTNLKCGQFRHKRQSLEQAIMQSEIVDIMSEELECIEKNLNLKVLPNKRYMKDDRNTKKRLLKAVLQFKSFKIQENRGLLNEFSCDAEAFSEGIFKENWYPTAKFLMKRYVTSKPGEAMCNLSSVPAEIEGLPISEVAKQNLKKAKQNKSNVMDIKSVTKNGQMVTSSEKAIKRKTKAFQDDLIWQSSHFGEAAAICHPDGSKLYPSKSKFRNMLVKHFQMTKVTKSIQSVIQEAASSLVSQEDIQKSKITSNVQAGCILGSDSKSWLNDAQIGNVMATLKSQFPTVQCQLLYPMPLDSVRRILNQAVRTKTFQAAIENETSCLIPYSDGLHWRLLLFHGLQKTVYHFDSLGGSIPDQIKDALSACTLLSTGWILDDVKEQYQADGYQCGVWVCLVMKYFFEFLRAGGLSKFSIVHFDEVYVLNPWPPIGDRWSPKQFFSMRLRATLVDTRPCHTFFHLDPVSRASQASFWCQQTRNEQGYHLGKWRGHTL